MRPRSFALVVLLAPAAAFAGAARGAASPSGGDPHVELRLDTAQADAVLAILAARRGGHSPRAEDWARLFGSEPYARLKRREAAMGRAFDDREFERFVLSPELAGREDELASTLERWKKADLGASARRALAYLPAGARLRAKVYPVVKPQSNSFVFELAEDPTIFLFLDPARSAAQFENTVAHELHHVGLAGVLSSPSATAAAPRSAELAAALEWMGAFGEGVAMLAAAGGPDVHPHAQSPPEERARWDRDMAGFDRDLRALERFFLDVLDGRLQGREATSRAGFAFFGVQGAWYTVGYGMAVEVERRRGRAALVECLRDPAELLRRYNAAVAERPAGASRPASWSQELLSRLPLR